VDALRSCDVEADVHVLPTLHGLLPRRFGDDEIWGLPLVRLKRNPLRRSVRRRVKRAMDIVGASVALAFAAPIMACVAVAVRRELGPDILFRQRRVGLDGREFELVKFRSMKPVVEGSPKAWSAAAPDRLGPVGRLIRKYSLDELPQLVNVLKGDMSLVGPRPELPEFVEEFSAMVPDYRHRARAPAGLTGLSAVVGLRGDTSIHQRAYFDNLYIDDWSLWSDVRILLRTSGAVLRGTGK
jgi:lipopolysaccharide/colanic/teichoic acid biosynthesis glycosyltransferase